MNVPEYQTASSAYRSSVRASAPVTRTRSPCRSREPGGMKSPLPPLETPSAAPVAVVSLSASTAEAANE